MVLGILQWFSGSDLIDAFTAMGLGSIPVGETKILQAVQCGKKKERKEKGVGFLQLHVNQ